MTDMLVVRFRVDFHSRPELASDSLSHGNFARGAGGYGADRCGAGAPASISPVCINGACFVPSFLEASSYSAAAGEVDCRNACLTALIRHV